MQDELRRLLEPGERVYSPEAPFAAIEGIYQTVDGKCRVLDPIELLSTQAHTYVAPSSLREAG